MESCQACTFGYHFNGQAVDLDLPQVPGAGRIHPPYWHLRPGRNRIDFGTGSASGMHGPGGMGNHGHMHLSAMRFSTGPVNDLAMGHTLKPGQSAAFYDPLRDGEGIFVELLNNGLAVVYMFTYTADGTGQQAWMLGVGEMIGGGIVVTQMYRPTGPSFGPDFDPDDRVLNPFGGMAFLMPPCGSSALAGSLFMLPPLDSGYEAVRSDNYVQLTRIVGCDDSAGHANAGYSGSWFDSTHDGEGIILEVLSDGRALVQWFTYDMLGNQMWVQGVGEFNGETLTVDRMYTMGGTAWGSMFDPDALFTQDWGILTMQFLDCGTATVRYQSNGFGNGTLNMRRLTTLLGIPCS